MLNDSDVEKDVDMERVIDNSLLAVRVAVGSRETVPPLRDNVKVTEGEIVTVNESDRPETLSCCDGESVSVTSRESVVESE